MSGTTTGVYSNSGHIGVGLLLIPAGAIAVSVGLSLAYVYVDVYFPIVGYISSLFLAGLVFGILTVISKLAHYSRCCNSLFLHGGIICVVVFYVSWAIFVYALLNRYDNAFDARLIDVVLAAGFVWAMARRINEEGWYSVFGFTPAGVVLWGM